MRGREIVLFATRWLALFVAGVVFLLTTESPFFPAIWLIYFLLTYGLAAMTLLLLTQSRFLADLYLFLDLFLVFAICLLAGKDRLIYSWLLVFFPIFAASKEDKGKLFSSFSLAALFILALEFGHFFSPFLEPAPYHHFLIQSFILLSVPLVLAFQWDKEPELKPVLEGNSLDRTDEYHRKLRQVVAEKDQTTQKLYDKIRQHAVLYEIIGHITHTLDMQKILELTVKRCKEELRSEIGFLMLAEGNDVAVRYSDGLSQPAVDVFRSRLGEKPFGHIVLTGECITENLDSQSHPVLDSLVSIKGIQRIRDLLAVPIKSPGPTLAGRGLLGVANSLETTGFSRDNMEMISILAGQSAIALDNAELAEKQKISFKEIIGALAAAINQKHKYTHVLHSKAVAKWAVDISREMRLPQPEIEKIEIAAILHDVGKIAIPDVVLTKPMELTPEETVILQQHAIQGGEILKGISMMKEIIPLIRHHHERWDGEGYPDRLKGEAIPLGTQIITVADAFDAMTTNRPYRQGLTGEEALETIKNQSGTQFSPKVVEAFSLVMMKLRQTENPKTALASQSVPSGDAS